MVQKGVVKLKYVPTEEQVAYVLTKPMAHVKFEYFRDKLGVVRKEYLFDVRLPNCSVEINQCLWKSCTWFI